MQLTWQQFLIVASVYATSDEDREEITYGQYLNVMEAAGFKQHESVPGTLRPPQRFKHLANGCQLLTFNPCGRSLNCEMLNTMQVKLQTRMRELYGLELDDFSVARKETWEDPADPNDPVPIADHAQFYDMVELGGWFYTYCHEQKAGIRGCRARDTLGTIAETDMWMRSQMGSAGMVVSWIFSECGMHGEEGDGYLSK